ncbi:MAG TPA: tetratricopeptide repeat protein [Thermoanaerobaculia bacterium]|nr:tetratricopeptide repeat protein [Thermoanaerobaculia bacterium]
MNRKLLPIMLLAALLPTATALAQIRLQGEVVDEKGKPIQGAQVTVQSPRLPDVAPVQTDRRGRWAVLLPVGGRWDIDITADGYASSLGTVNAIEAQRMPSIKTVLQGKPEPVPQPQPQEPDVSSTVPPEAVEAVQMAEAWVRQAEGKATVEDSLRLGMSASIAPVPAKQKKELYARAVAEYEKAQALLPDHIELKKALARAYYASGELKPAIGLLKQVHAAEPDNSGIALLLVNLLAEAEDLEGARQVLDALPEQALTDATAVVNVGILFLNKAAPKEAIRYLDRAVSIDPAKADSYYYRAIARLHMKDMALAKGDLQKVIELAPDSPEAQESRDLLKQIK